MAEDLSRQLKKVSISEKDAPNGIPLSLEGVAKAIKDGKIKNIIIMTGAGISVSAGIPDFRSPGTGLYDNLQKYNLPHPESIFEINFFQREPKAFCMLAKELYPGNFCPTPTHCFIRLLAEKKVLLRNFTQNIDTLELGAGIPEEKLVQAHGGFNSAHCLKCKKKHDPENVRKVLFQDEIPRCDCGGLIKPDIVFFGEGLPQRFHELSKKDFPKCDLLIIAGTSLTVHPFAGLIEDVTNDTIRILFNREPAGVGNEAVNISERALQDIKKAAQQGDFQAIMLWSMLQGKAKGLRIGRKDNTRDIFVKGDCDPAFEEFAKLLGWEEDLKRIIAEVKAKHTSEERKKQTPRPTKSSPEPERKKTELSSKEPEKKKTELSSKEPEKKKTELSSKVPEATKTDSEPELGPNAPAAAEKDMSLPEKTELD
ncbi:hypothetical protein AAMO2058_000667400 [Amorphochlora amoebiformis]